MKKKSWIIGIDEAGRGPLAGPVYVGVYAVPVSFDINIIRGVRDSKKLSEQKREHFFTVLTEIPTARYSVGYCTEKTIDTKGITKSIRTALERALNRLDIDPRNCEVLLDGGLKAPKKYIHQKTIIRGDQKIKVISAASILAKVSRDRRMYTLAKQHPKYGLEQHKGYGTRLHREMITKFGLADVHRRSFCRKQSGTLPIEK